MASVDPKQLVVYIPDSRGVTVSRYGKGNLKIGERVFTYSRLPGTRAHSGTCPGATPLCESICYAKRVIQEHGIVADMWEENSFRDDVPEIPADCKILRLHVSGDFDTANYIVNWTERLVQRPDVQCWGYTRSWRVPELLPYLDALRALPNVQLFASMDDDIPELPPAGWRRAWIEGDARLRPSVNSYGTIAFDKVYSLVCPEETKRMANCEECKYCFDGVRGDVCFLRH